MIERFLLSLMLAMPFVPSQIWAQGQYPSRPIVMIIPAPPGGPTDIGGRLLAKELSEALGQSVIPENRPGAATIVGVAMLSRAAPDGYTIGALANAGVTSPFAMGREVPYKLEDLAPLGTVAFDYSLVTIRAEDNRWKSLNDLMNYARKNPGKLTYGAPGVGSMGHLSMEFVKLAYGANIEFLPYAGSAPTITSLLGGHVDIGSANVSVSLPHIKAGKLTALAIASPKRVASLPDVPTVGELGKGDPPSFWLGAFVPARTPAPIIQKLAKTIEQILAAPEMNSLLERAGFVVDYRTPAETSKLIAEEIETIRKVAKTLHLK